MFAARHAAHCFERSKGVGELGFGDFILFSQHKHLPLPDGALLIFNGSGVSKIEAKEAAFSHIIVIFNQLPKFNFKQKIFLFFWIFKRLLQIFGIPLSIIEVEKESELEKFFNTLHPDDMSPREALDAIFEMKKRKNGSY